MWAMSRLAIMARGRFPNDLGEPRISGQGARGTQHINLELSTMTTGTVKWFNATKGYGFITPDDGSRDAFLHISAVERAGLTSVNEGQRVEYELQTGRNGKMSAENLSIVD